MVYFLGRDCEVYLTTETSAAAAVSTGATDAMTTTTGGANIFFAGVLADGTGATAVLDLTGVDLSIGAVDEDITYFGVRSVTKAEIKKETTVSLTKKKSDSAWDAVWDGGRNGVSGTSFTANDLRDPTTITGYRIHVVLKGGSEVFTVPNCCVQSHSTSINADGTSEETMEFMSYVSPNVGNEEYVTATTAAEL